MCLPEGAEREGKVGLSCFLAGMACDWPGGWVVENACQKEWRRSIHGWSSGRHVLSPGFL